MRTVTLILAALMCMGAADIDPPAAMYTPRFIKNFPMDTVTEAQLLQAWGAPTSSIDTEGIRLMSFDNTAGGTSQQVLFTIKDGVVINAAVRWGRGKWHRARE